MANLKEIRTRIASVKNTRQVTSAMKMVSAAKLRKAQDTILKIRPYTDELNLVAQKLAVAVGEEYESPLAQKRDQENILVILVTSNKGLCGIFNGAITKMATDWARSNHSDAISRGRLEFLTIGKKGNATVKREGFKIWKSVDELLDHNSFAKSTEVARELIDEFSQKRFDRIVLFYNQFKNAATQIPTIMNFLPIELKDGNKSGMSDDYILEPSPEVIIEDLLPKILQIGFHSAILDSIASEHGARMTAMHKATDNATDLLEELTLNYNKARQASITNEILEIVSGANALGK